MIEIKNITKKFDNLEVLKGIDLVIPDHEIVTIVGASGAGKTTLLQIVGTLEKPTTGSILFDNKRVDNMPDNEMARFRNANIGFVFQFHQLLPEFTALENVMIPAMIGGAKASAAEKRARQLLDYLRLSDRTSHKPAQLSGGEKQRVAVARALVNNPAVILADEPSGSLDTHNKTELHKLFFDLRQEFGHTFVIVTHDESLAEVSDRTVRMQDGVILSDIYHNNPQNKPL
ncbi:MAG: ABC transporter ATP-binding protein [Bacteroidaceae bacterium]|nr:ABC transporter ATP-binding protein [Bacteroidaceae bacterium]MBR6749764.1 ABC transporter ATP-binding protein [Bacteroidaceae bacterium]